MNKKVYFVVFIFVAVVTVAWAKFSGGAGKDTEIKLVRPVPTFLVKGTDNFKTLNFPGIVRAKNRVELAFSVPGLLNKLNATEGREVKAGEALAILDQRDYKNNLAAAKATLDEAKQNFLRTKKLKEQSVITQAELDKAKAGYEIAEAKFRMSEKDLEDTVLKAPFNGIVAKRYVENFEHIQAKQPIISLQDISVMEVVIHVPENIIARGGVSSLKDVRVSLEADSSQSFAGEICEYSVEADVMTRTYDVVIAVKPPKGLNIYPGMTASITVKTGIDDKSSVSSNSVIVVPVNAVMGGSDGNSYVWVIPENEGHPQKVKVDIGKISNEGIVIKSGLKPGVRVATAGIHSLSENMDVRPMVEGKEGLEG